MRSAPSRSKQAFRALLASDDDSDSSKQTDRRSGSGRRRTSSPKARPTDRLPGFRLRDEPAGAAGVGDPLQELLAAFGGSLPADVIADVYSACGRSANASAAALLELAGAAASPADGRRAAAAARSCIWIADRQPAHSPVSLLWHSRRGHLQRRVHPAELRAGAGTLLLGTASGGSQGLAAGHAAPARAGTRSARLPRACRARARASRGDAHAEAAGRCEPPPLSLPACRVLCPGHRQWCAPERIP